MCLLVFSLRKHARYPFIFAGNRDEFYGRPASPADFWEEHPDLLAGRDELAGGTWLGVTRGGRFATVTNYREPNERRLDARSRGELVTEYLTGTKDAADYLTSLQNRADQYNGFNLILGTPDELYYFSNRTAREDEAEKGDLGTPGRIHELEAGVYGLSNEQLDTPWPKVRRAKALFHKIIAESGPKPAPLLDVLADRRQAIDGELPSTGLSLEWEQALSSIFITGAEYGTRASTVVLIRDDGEITFVERSFGPGGTAIGTKSYRIPAKSYTE